MKKTQLYLLAFLIALAGVSAFLLKWRVLSFPLSARAQTEIWELQARIGFQGRNAPARVSLQLPVAPPGYTVLDQRFVGRHYGMGIQKRDGGSQVDWTIRSAEGEQWLYYRATVFKDQGATEDLPPTQPVIPAPAPEPYATARAALLDDARAKTVNNATLAAELVRRLGAVEPSEEVKLLNEHVTSLEERAELVRSLLAEQLIHARLLRGLVLAKNAARAELLPLLQVWEDDRQQWVAIDMRQGQTGWPEGYFLWTRNDRPLLEVEGGRQSQIEFSIKRGLADSLQTATQNLAHRDRNWIAYSLLDLPLQAQEIYKILLLVPVGAFIMLILRNLVGIKTFGTFMPVLIALAFNWTGMIPGVILFASVISLGLLVRFYMERLKLLLVPRLTAVLIVVVLLMAGVSVISNRLGFEVGLNVALFPMIIMTMTIERVSVAWEERGPGYAIRQALGSLLIAALAYLVMKETHLQHLIFVFPELLLVLLGLTLVLGRYSGYRLTELVRFRALARDPVSAAAPGTPPVA